MTTLVAQTATDMTAWDFLADITVGSVAAHTAADWTVNGANGAVYSFTGQNLDYDTDLLPVSGTIKGLSFTENAVPRFSISGGIPAADVAKFIDHDDMLGLQRQWFDGDDIFNGSSASDHLLGYSGNDLFRLDNGGADSVDGGKGADTFQMRASFGTTDQIDGGRGVDTLRLNADYFLFFTPEMMANVEVIQLTQGKDYVLHFVSGNVGKGGLTVDGSTLHAGSLEVYMDGGNRGFSAIGGDKGDVFVGGGGKDEFAGGGAGDRLEGGGGADVLTGGTGQDVFVFGSSHDTTGPHFDTIRDFNGAVDEIALNYSLAGLDTAVNSGALTHDNFNNDLETAVNGSALGALHAVLFTPDSGDFAGDTFLVIDKNNVAGFQSGKDFVIFFEDTSKLDTFGLEDFILDV